MSILRSKYSFINHRKSPIVLYVWKLHVLVEVIFFPWIVSSDGTQVDPRNNEVVINCPKPLSASDI